MKSVLVAASVLASALVLFVSGMVAATMLYTSGEQPHRFTGLDTAALWTNRPVAVEQSGQTFQRLAAKEAPPEPAITHKPGTDISGTQVDVAARSIVMAPDIGTQDIGGEAINNDALGSPEQSEGAAVLSPDHIAWCQSQYRSYNPQDNSYRPYSGGNRPCISPYGNDAASMDIAETPAEDVYDTADDFDDYAPRYDSQHNPRQDAGDLRPPLQTISSSGEPGDDLAAWQHEEKCFALYRSYRPDDNTYQPHDGGPRRQCE